MSASAVAVSAMRGTPGKRSREHRELQVLGPEVVAPLRHAVRLVDREQRDARGVAELVEQAEERLGEQPLGRDVEQVELARAEPARAPRARRPRPGWS